MLIPPIQIDRLVGTVMCSILADWIQYNTQYNTIRLFAGTVAHRTIDENTIYTYTWKNNIYFKNIRGQM